MRLCPGKVKVGFHTWYRRQGVTYVAIRLACLVEQSGYLATMLAFGHHDQDVHPTWDGRVCGATTPLSVWSSQCRLVVWPEFILPDAVQNVMAAGARTVLLPMWEQLLPGHEAALKMYDHIVCVSQACAALLQERWQLPQLRYIPFDLGLEPLQPHKPWQPERLDLFYPAAGPQARRQGALLLPMLGRLLAADPRVHLTITYLRQWPVTARSVLRQLQQQFAGTGRVRVLTNLPWREHMQLYAQHDLTLWPTTNEGLGLLGLESLSQHTPVMAFDLPPINEYLRHGVNAWLLPCARSHNWLGVPSGIPEPGIMEEELRRVTYDQALLQALLEGARAGPQARAQHCIQGWRDLLAT